MTSDKTAAIEKLERLCSEGQRVFVRDRVIPPAYVDQLVVPALDKAMALIGSEIGEPHQMPPETEEATLRVTHYTSLAAVTSMLRALTEGQEASLRLYDSVHCNDPDEGNYLVRGLSSDSTHRWLARGSAAGHAYITSFVDGQGKPDMSDDLVFWGPYGKDGSGCSMTLNVSQTLLRKVLYGPVNVGVAKKILKSVLDPVTPIAQANEDFAEAISGNIWRHLESVRYLYKDQPYHHEKEFRVAIPAGSPNIEADRVRFEPYEQDGSLVQVRHYYEISGLALGSLFTSGSKLVLGPSVKDRYSVRLYLEDLRRRIRLRDPMSGLFDIGVSQIRYRGQ